MGYRQRVFAEAGEGIDNLDAYLATNPSRADAPAAAGHRRVRHAGQGLPRRAEVAGQRGRRRPHPGRAHDPRDPAPGRRRQRGHPRQHQPPGGAARAEPRRLDQRHRRAGRLGDRPDPDGPRLRQARPGRHHPGADRAGHRPRGVGGLHAGRRPPDRLRRRCPSRRAPPPVDERRPDRPRPADRRHRRRQRRRRLRARRGRSGRSRWARERPPPLAADPAERRRRRPRRRWRVRLDRCRSRSPTTPTGSGSSRWAGTSTAATCCCMGIPGSGTSTTLAAHRADAGRRHAARRAGPDDPRLGLARPRRRSPACRTPRRTSAPGRRPRAAGAVPEAPPQRARPPPRRPRPAPADGACCSTAWPRCATSTTTSRACKLLDGLYRAYADGPDVGTVVRRRHRARQGGARRHRRGDHAEVAVPARRHLRLRLRRACR